MQYSSIGQFLEMARPAPGKGPVALILAEDNCETAATLRHHLRLGFGRVVLLAGEEIILPPSWKRRSTGSKPMPLPKTRLSLP